MMTLGLSQNFRTVPEPQNFRTVPEPQNFRTVPKAQDSPGTLVLSLRPRVPAHVTGVLFLLKIFKEKSNSRFLEQYQSSDTMGVYFFLKSLRLKNLRQFRDLSSPGKPWDGGTAEKEAQNSPETLGMFQNLGVPTP